MKYDPNVYGYVNGKPTYSRDEFIFTVRGFGPIENDADLLALKPVINAVLSAFKKLWKVSVRAIGVPPKWLHLAAHAKKARTRKKYRNRIRRYVFEALAAEGGGGP